MNASEKTLYELAKSAFAKAYSPYSQKSVGAAIRLSNGQVFSGCNVENSSYGGTVCAERVAILKGVSETHTGNATPINARPQIETVMVVTDASPPWPPCGLCRQVIAEFATPKTQIITANLKGESKVYAFHSIFPEAFSPSHLMK